MDSIEEDVLDRSWVNLSIYTYARVKEKKPSSSRDVDYFRWSQSIQRKMVTVCYKSISSLERWLGDFARMLCHVIDLADSASVPWFPTGCLGTYSACCSGMISGNTQNFGSTKFWIPFLFRVYENSNGVPDLLDESASMIMDLLASDNIWYLRFLHTVPLLIIHSISICSPVRFCGFLWCSFPGKELSQFRELCVNVLETC